MRSHADLLAYIDLVAPAVGLPVAPAHRDAIAAALAVLMGQGDLLLAMPLPPELECAARYAP